MELIIGTCIFRVELVFGIDIKKFVVFMYSFYVQRCKLMDVALYKNKYYYIM